MVNLPTGLPTFVDDRHRHEVVALERARRLCRGVGRTERQRIGIHDGRNRRVGLRQDQRLQTHGSAQQVSRVHNEQTVELIGQIGARLKIVEHLRRWSASRGRS